MLRLNGFITSGFEEVVALVLGKEVAGTANDVPKVQKEDLATKTGDKTVTKPAPKRTIGNLPAALPRIEEVINTRQPGLPLWLWLDAQDR